MGKDKLRRFAEFKSFSNCYDFNYDLKGKWHEEVFHNNHPIVLELGCGKGEYTVALARQYPQINFLGIDLKSNRMWRGAGIALEEKLSNAAFLRLILHKITDAFDEGEISEIWITFPDPYPKERHAKHRLTHPRFLKLYKKILKPGGTVHLKTDDPDLFTFTVDMLPETGIEPLVIDRDVHHNPHADPALKNIRTYYENLFMARGRTINYTQFKLDGFDLQQATSWEEKVDFERKLRIHGATS